MKWPAVSSVLSVSTMMRKGFCRSSETVLLSMIPSWVLASEVLRRPVHRLLRELIPGNFHRKNTAIVCERLHLAVGYRFIGNYQTCARSAVASSANPLCANPSADRRWRELTSRRPCMDGNAGHTAANARVWYIVATIISCSRRDPLEIHR